MKAHHILFSLISCLILATVNLNAQDNVRSQLFSDADQEMNRAKEKKADLYAPKSFGKAVEYYNEADDSYKRGRNLDEIRQKLKNAIANFLKSVDACKLGEVTFAATMGARDDAARAGAPKYTPELWKKAEMIFQKAARTLEDGDVKSAKERGGEAETGYRKAELEAIKANYLSPARELLKKADELNVKEEAPKTLGKAEKLTLEVEKLLQQNRYDTDEARQLAEEAKYEATHALYLSQTIRQMKKEEKSFEDVMLEAEKQFQRIAAALDMQGRFENGLDNTVSETVAAVKARDARAARDADSLRRAADAIRDGEGEIDNLKQQIGSMKSRLGSLTDAEIELQRKLNIKHQQEESIRQVARMFMPEEGNVLRDGDNIVIRLYGLTFPVGKSIIETQYYSLLTKVQEAIKKFPNCRVAIEGHTDSQGSDDVNQKLSEGRAKAVAEYLMANMGVEIPLTSQGFGETRPVASNDTPEGKAKNRRIDVVITPEWAGTGK